MRMIFLSLDNTTLTGLLSLLREAMNVGEGLDEFEHSGLTALRTR